MQAIVDCNSFYCSCERLFQPQLHHRPVIVLSNNDGCIVSRTDEAKQLGISMAVPYFQAKDLIEKNGGYVKAIACGFNRSSLTDWNGIPIISALDIPTEQFTQEDPLLRLQGRGAGLVLDGK